MKKSKIFDAKTLAVCGMLCAAAYALVTVSHFVMPSLVPAAPWLKYDPKDIIIAIGGLMLGPIPAVAMSAVVSLLEMISYSETGWIGLVMNIVSSCAFVLPAAILYRKKRRLDAAVAGLVFGVLFVTAVMLLWNYLLTPIYMGMPRDFIKDLLLPAFLPFNMIKGALNAAFTFLVYKPLSKALKRAHLLPQGEPSERSKGVTLPIAVFSLLTIAVCVLVILIINDII